VAVQGGGLFRGVRAGSTLQWTALNNGLPAGIVVTDLKRLGTARVVLGSYGRGAFVITTGALITAVPERQKGDLLVGTAYDTGKGRMDPVPIRTSTPEYTVQAHAWFHPDVMSVACFVGLGRDWLGRARYFAGA
jgi:hypothetical protein